MLKVVLACLAVLSLALAGWAQTSAQTSTSGSAQTGVSAGQTQPAPQPQPPASSTNDDDARMARPQGSAPPAQPSRSPSEPGADAQQPPVGSGVQAATMVHAELNKTIDAKKAKPGDEVVAKTTTDFRTSNGTRVPKGTKLLGKVTEAKRHDKNAGAEGQSKLAFAFDRAVLKDKTEIPVQVVVQAIGAAQPPPPPGPDAAVSGGGMGSAQGNAGAGGPLGGTVGAAGSAAGGVAAGAGQTVGAVGDAAGSTVGATTSAVGDVAGSAGPMVDASGRLTAQSQGAVGLKDLQLQSSAESNTQAAVVTSDKKNVKLSSGTQLVLRVSAQ